MSAGVSPSHTCVILVGSGQIVPAETPALLHICRMASSAAMSVTCRMIWLLFKYQPRS